MEFYLLSCETPEKGGGVYRYDLTDTGLQKIGYFPCDSPMYAVCEKDELFVLLRQPFFEQNAGGCFSIDLDLQNPSEIISTEGVVPCHLCVDGEDCYVVNYLSGNIVNVGKKTIQHEGKGENPNRQDMPHTHQAIFSPDKKYVLCCDLGLDFLFCYDRELNLVSKAKVADGYGIRHAVFSKDGRYIYAISEMTPSVHIFSYEGGRVAFIKKYDVVCERKNADGAAIRLSDDGRKLYLSLRVENALVVCDVDGENLQFLQKVNCGGDSPRDFNLIGEYLIVTNEKSDNSIVYRLKDGLIQEQVFEIKLPNPLCFVV